MLHVTDVMTKDPICCLKSTSLKAVAQLMVKYDCGLIPVVYSMDRAKIIGVITDRDIVARALARGLNPMELVAEDCMTTPAKIIKDKFSIADCCRLMDDEKLRRLPVIGEDEMICGIISLSDIATYTNDFRFAPIFKNISSRSDVKDPAYYH